MQWIVLAGLAISLAFSVFARGAFDPQDWHPSAALIGISAGVWSFRRRHRQARSFAFDRLTGWLLIAFLALPFLQIIPLPFALTELISPQAAAAARSLAPIGGVPSFLPVSLYPEFTREIGFRLLAYVLTLFLVCDISRRQGFNRFYAAVPLIAVALSEALIGIAQAFAGLSMARGTYPNRNHFAGLLEITLPFALAWGLSLLRHDRSRFESAPTGRILLACLMFGTFTILLAGVLQSLSRMGFIASLAGVATVFLVLTRPDRKLSLALSLAGTGVVIILAFLILPGTVFIDRFAGIATGEEISAETRRLVWGNTFQLIAAYPVTGCGLGDYEDGLLPWQTSAPLHTVDFAHNDYLQVLAEAGPLGLVLFVAIGLRLLLGVIRAAREDTSTRYVAAACCGAIVAMALHSLTDFNLYIPANGLAFSWICGLAASFLVPRTSRTA